MDIYFISGLGADKRAFSKLKLPDEFIIHHLDWISPEKNESIARYAKRLSEKIDTSKPFCLLGLSFGGIMAVEISKILKPVQTILISSVATEKEIPFYFRFAGRFRLDKVIPFRLFMSFHRLNNWLFGTETAAERKLLKNIIIDTDIDFVQWAVTGILNWKNTSATENLFHIHGNSDMIFPVGFVKPDRIVDGGGHFMVYNRYQIVSEIISERLVSSGLRTSHIHP